MSDIVSGVLKHTFGFLANKIRKEVAERLKDGDVTDEECRRLIVRELDDIKSKLDGLARKDLLSSLCFLQEGVNRLYQSLQFPLTEEATVVEATTSKDLVPNSPRSVNEATALINAITSLKLLCNERFNSAKESFKLSREKATDAFCNEALSIEDRIQASQIRMMARILENLKDPDASVSDCLQYLQQLHEEDAICEMFSVLIDGGLKSRLNRTRRLNNASFVQDMKITLFNFAQKFTKLPVGIFDWPTIIASKKIYNPVFGKKCDSLVGKVERSGVQLTSRCPHFTFATAIPPQHSAVNSKGEIVAKLSRTNIIKMFTRSSESRTVCKVPVEERASNFDVVAMDIDAKDNVYVLTPFRESEGQSWGFKLRVFDENGNKKLETSLSFHQSADFPPVPIAISKEGRIAILHYDEKIVYIGKVCVEMNSYEVERSFHLKKLETDIAMDGNLQISDANGTKIIVNGFRTIYIYAENGQLKHEIKIPGEHMSISSIAIDHTTKDILVTTYNSVSYPEKGSLLSFSETGELVYSLSLNCYRKWDNTKLTSHPNGAVVLVGETKAMIIKGQLK